MELSKELKDKIELYVSEANELSGLVIDSNEKYEQAIMFGKEIQKKIKEVEAEKKKMTDPLEQSKKAIIDFFRPALEKLTAVKSLINSNGLVFYEKQERIRAEAQRKLQEEAAEKQRILDEKIAQKQAEGKNTDKLESKKAEIITPVLQSNVTKVSGTYVKETWKAKVIDFKLLPDEYKIANQMALDGIAKATKGSINIPGVVMEVEKSIVNRS